jgi:hypothetical protein
VTIVFDEYWRLLAAIGTTASPRLPKMTFSSFTNGVPYIEEDGGSVKY